MKHTGALLEVLIIGLMAAVWVGLALFRTGVVDAAVIAKTGTDYKDWATLLTFASLAVCYQLGWIVNTLGIWLGELLVVGLRGEIFGNGSYDEERTYVYQHGTDAMLGHLDVQRNAIRLIRAGIINFAALGMVLLLSRDPKTRIGGGLAMAGALICVLQLRYRCRRYYKRLKAAYNVVSLNQTTPGVGPIATEGQDASAMGSPSSSEHAPQPPVRDGNGQAANDR